MSNYVILVTPDLPYFYPDVCGDGIMNECKNLKTGTLFKRIDVVIACFNVNLNGKKFIKGECLNVILLGGILIKQFNFGYERKMRRYAFSLIRIMQQWKSS